MFSSECFQAQEVCCKKPVLIFFEFLIVRYKKPAGCPVSSRQKSSKQSYSLVYQNESGAAPRGGIELKNVKV